MAKLLKLGQSNSIMEKRLINFITPLLLGFGIGMCVSLIVTGTLYIRNNIPVQSSFNSTISVSTMSPTLPSIIPTTTQTLITPLSSEEILMEAEKRILNGNAESGQELLLSSIETWTSYKDKAHGYKLLGDAEVSKGHFKLAIPYYEKTFFYQPTPDNLFTIAITEDMSGNLCDAFKHYQELNSWENSEGTFDKDFVKARIEDISCVLGTKVP